MSSCSLVPSMWKTMLENLQCLGTGQWGPAPGDDHASQAVGLMWTSAPSLVTTAAWRSLDLAACLGRHRSSHGVHTLGWVVSGSLR